MSNFKFKKKYGQNFLKNPDVIIRMLKLVDLTKDDLVIEIGPGSGALTTKLLEKTRVIAYEIDMELKETLEAIKSNDLTIIYDDFLKRNVKRDIGQISYRNLYLISNIPYYITTPIILKVIDEELDVKKIVLMVQKELGERFAAPVGKNASSITVLLNYYFDLKKEFLVGKNNFYPQPKVDSVIISLSKKSHLEILYDKDLFFNLIRDAFQFKRKTIKNNLKKYDLEKIEKVLKKYNYDLTVRSENLDYKIFVEIANSLSSE